MAGEEGAGGQKTMAGGREEGGMTQEGRQTTHSNQHYIYIYIRVEWNVDGGTKDDFAHIKRNSDSDFGCPGSRACYVYFFPAGGVNVG